MLCTMHSRMRLIVEAIWADGPMNGLDSKLCTHSPQVAVELAPIMIQTAAFIVCRGLPVHSIFEPPPSYLG
jgi:hypothetical protein